MDGGFGTWGAWGPCTADCGGGLRERLRLCDNPKPQHGGNECQGEHTEMESCNTDKCKGKDNTASTIPEKLYWHFLPKKRKIPYYTFQNVLWD